MGNIDTPDNGEDSKSLLVLDMPFVTSSAAGHQVTLSTRYTFQIKVTIPLILYLIFRYSKVTMENKSEFVKMALQYRLHEFDPAIGMIREGMARVVPVPLLSLFTGFELETMVCGSPEIPISLLKSVTTYKGKIPICTGGFH